MPWPLVGTVPTSGAVPIVSAAESSARCRYRCSCRPSSAQKFVRCYNNEHKHSDLKFVTPAHRHGRFGDAIFKQREEVYQAVRNRNARRWTQGTRNCEFDNQVWQNLERIQPEELNSQREVARQLR